MSKLLSVLSNYSPEIYIEALRKLFLPNYELFDDIDKAYENFIQNVIAVIDNLSSSKYNRFIGHRKTDLMQKSRKE